MDEDCIVVDEWDARKMSTKSADILHLHWPDLILRDKRRWRLRIRFGRLLKAIRRLHARNGKLVWTVHNLLPHSVVHTDLAEKYLQKFVVHVDGLIFLSNDSRDQFLQLYPQARNTAFSIIPHMHYQYLYQEMPRAMARAKFGISEQELVLLVFGKIRPHKGIEKFLTVMEYYKGESCRLLLAGSPGKKGTSVEIQRYIVNHPKTVALLRHIDDEEIPGIFAASDVVVLPYKNILNSGTALLALSLGRPVIAPALGSLPELQQQVGENWLYLYKPELTEKSLGEALNWVKSRRIDKGGPYLSEMAPEKVSALTKDFYNQLNQPY